METDSGPVKQLEKKYYYDSTYITVPREGVEINTPLRDGLGELSSSQRWPGVYGLEKRFTVPPPPPPTVENWDLYQGLIDVLYSRHLKTTPTEHPVLMSEPPVCPNLTFNTLSISLCFSLSCSFSLVCCGGCSGT